MRRRALQNTPTLRQLENLDLQVPHRKFESAMAIVARQMGTSFEDGLLHLPDSLRDDPSYPTALRVLYRKFSCDFLQDSRDGNCLSFDVIPVGVRGDPRRYKSYRSFQGELEEGEDLFQQLLRFLRHVVQAVLRHQKI